ncbi:MAG: hypothetical protein AVDCRST_MAG90-2004, partial [uncultured Microvirga sp.]
VRQDRQRPHLESRNAERHGARRERDHRVRRPDAGIVRRGGRPDANRAGRRQPRARDGATAL